MIRHVGEGFSLRLEAARCEPFSEYISKLPGTAVMAVIGLAPVAGKALLELDAPLAMAAVERMLGGRAETMPEPRPLSETEQGVLEYLLLQVLAHIHRSCGGDARVHFRFERFAFDPRAVQGWADDGSNVAVLTFRIGLGARGGFVRLALPDPFIEETMLEVEAPGEEREGERAARVAAMRRLAHVSTQLKAEAGRMTLMPEELAQLEEGDVILFDEGRVHIDGGHPAGTAILRVGDGLHGGIEADVEADGERLHCTVRGVFRGE